MALVVTLSVGRLPQAAAQSVDDLFQIQGQSQSQSPWGQWGGEQNQSGGSKCGMYDDMSRCDDIESRTGYQFGARLITVPVMREDGQSVFSPRMCDRIRRCSQSCMVFVKVRPCMEMNCGADSVIEYRHFNPNHHPGDEKIYAAMRRLWSEAHSLGIDKYLAFAPEANSPCSKWFVQTGMNSTADYRSAFQMFVKAGRDEGCGCKPIWSISQSHNGCVDLRDMYPGDAYVGGFGGTAYYCPEWSKDQNGQWSAGWHDQIGSVCDELDYFNHWLRLPCFMETGVQKGPWTADCMRDMSRSCHNRSYIVAVILNNMYEENGCGKNMNWRWDDCMSSRSDFKNLCDSFGHRDW